LVGILILLLEPFNEPKRDAFPVRRGASAPDRAQIRPKKIVDNYMHIPKSGEFPHFQPNSVAVK
jgi:hypothetical protein